VSIRRLLWRWGLSRELGGRGREWRIGLLRLGAWRRTVVRRSEIQEMKSVCSLLKTFFSLPNSTSTLSFLLFFFLVPLFFTLNSLSPRYSQLPSHSSRSFLRIFLLHVLRLIPEVLPRASGILDKTRQKTWLPITTYSRNPCFSG
jgi:hypothetical protein